MTKMFFGISTLLVIALWCGSCTFAPTPILPTPAPFALPTLIPPTRVPPTATASPTLTPTLVPASPTSTPAEMVTGTATPTLSDLASPTVVSPTPTATPFPSPTLAIPRGLYVTDLRIDPSPVRGVDLKFIATFQNSMEHEQNYRWAVYVFRADTQRGTGETTRTDLPIPTGTVQQPSNGAWKLPLGGPCEYFYAQVGWLNAEKKIVWFTQPGGATFQKGFAVCPP